MQSLHHRCTPDCGYAERTGNDGAAELEGSARARRPNMPCLATSTASQAADVKGRVPACSATECCSVKTRTPSDQTDGHKCQR